MMNEDKPNYSHCFAQSSALKYSCAILDEKLCETRKRCPFFKTQEQFDNDAARAAAINAKNTIKIKKVSCMNRKKVQKR